ncbi:MAG TPA: zeta toxin family protein [Solimonas sp.]
MPLKYPEPAVLPPGFVLDPPASPPPYRNATPPPHALMGPDYGQRFLQQSLSQASSPQWRTVEDPGLMTRLHQGLLRRRQRNAAEHALRMADYLHALEQPGPIPEEQRSRVPSDPGQRAAAHKNADQMYRRVIKRTAQLQREQDLIPDSDFMRAWRDADAQGAARLAWQQPGPFLRDFAAPEMAEAVPTVLAMAMSGRMAGGIGKDLGLTAEGQRRTALAGASAVGARDGYEISTSAEMFRQLCERGIDPADPDALAAAFLDRELMAEVMSPARNAGRVGAAAGAASPVLASKVFGPAAAGPVRRELTNAAAQVPMQASLSGGASALSGKLVRGEVDWKEVIAAAISPAMLAPLDVATAGVGGYRRRREVPHESGRASLPSAEDYSRLAAEQAGNPDYFNADLAKELFPEYAGSSESRRAMSDALQQQAAAIRDEAFQRRLAQQALPGEVVTFMAGGTGSGKSSATPENGIVYDTTLTNLKGAIELIEHTLASGRVVNINYVATDPIVAWNRAIARARIAGRAVPLQIHAATHEGANSTVLTLEKRYRNEPRVRVLAFDNSGKNITQLDRVPEIRYNDLQEQLNEILRQELESGGLDEATYQAFGGGAVPR